MSPKALISTMVIVTVVVAAIIPTWVPKAVGAVAIVALLSFLRRKAHDDGTEKRLPPAQAAQLVEREKVIERQVIVVRCKFCGTLTPADFSVCEQCGAAKFS